MATRRCVIRIIPQPCDLHRDVPVLSPEKEGRDKQSPVKELPKTYYESTVIIVELGKPRYMATTDILS